MAPTRLPHRNNSAIPARESKTAKRERAELVLERLRVEFPEAHGALNWENPLQLLVATMLSAQCTDERVNQVTPALFRRFPGAADYAAASQSQVEELVRSTGFFRNKAKNIRGTGSALMARHGGEVPQTMEELLALPGVARKTANCVLSQGFGIEVGLVVDTHVGRIARRMGLTREQNPVKVERELMELFPHGSWTYLSHAWIDLGRAECTARSRPRCEECAFADLCPQRVG